MLTIPIDDAVLLKMLMPADAEPLFQLVDANRAMLRQWLPWLDITRTVEDTRDFIASVHEKYASQWRM